MTNLRDMVDPRTLDRLRTLVGVEVNSAATSPDRTDEGRNPGRGKQRTSERKKLVNRVGGQERTKRSRSPQQSTEPPAYMAKTGARLDKVESRLRELRRQLQCHPSPNSIFIARSRGELQRELASIKQSLAVMDVEAAHRAQFHKAKARAKRLTGEVEQVKANGSPARGPSSSGGAIHAPRALRPTTPGPDSPNYYEDPVNSK